MGLTVGSIRQMLHPTSAIVPPTGSAFKRIVVPDDMKCSISECHQKAIQTVKVGRNETRLLCHKHLLIYMDQGTHHTPVFYKASNMLDEP